MKNEKIIKSDHLICLTSLSDQSASKKSKVKIYGKNPHLALKCKIAVFILTDWAFSFAPLLTLFIPTSINFYRKVHFLWGTKVCLLNLKSEKLKVSGQSFLKHTNVTMCRVGQKKASLTLALSTVPSKCTASPTRLCKA